MIHYVRDEDDDESVYYYYYYYNIIFVSSDSTNRSVAQSCTEGVFVSNSTFPEAAKNKKPVQKMIPILKMYIICNNY